MSELTRMDYGDDELKTMVSALNDTLSEEEGQKRDVDQIRTAAVKMRDWAKKSLAEINRSYSPAKKQAPKVKTAQQQQSPTMKRKAVSSANTANSTKKTAKTNTTVQISVPKNTGGRRAPKKH